jgi:hypothetical protein
VPGERHVPLQNQVETEANLGNVSTDVNQEEE